MLITTKKLSRTDLRIAKIIGDSSGDFTGEEIVCGGITKRISLSISEKLAVVLGEIPFADLSCPKLLEDFPKVGIPFCPIFRCLNDFWKRNKLISNKIKEKT